MNNNYYQPDIYEASLENQQPQQPTAFINRSAQNILNQNRGKVAKFYMSFTNSIEERDVAFVGVLENANDEYLIISDPATGKWKIIKIEYLNYIDFDEKVNY